jgi:hypothetical protein
MLGGMAPVLQLIYINTWGMLCSQQPAGQLAPAATVNTDAI